MTVTLLAMMVCPAIAAAQSAASKPNHCSSEKQPDNQKQTTMRGCCDQNAVSVQKVHAPFEMSDLQMLNPVAGIAAQAVLQLHFDFRPFEETGDHLSKLSVLRL
jgi:hypothetical protein